MDERAIQFATMLNKILSNPDVVYDSESSWDDPKSGMTVKVYLIYSQVYKVHYFRGEPVQITYKTSSGSGTIYA